MYGSNSDDLRTPLALLLRHHRIQSRLGADHNHRRATTTIAEREELAHQILRYRQSILIWCRQAVRASSPYLIARTSGHPAYQLLHDHLTEAINTPHLPIAPLDEITTTQPNSLVETWRQAARAATLGEHDFSAGIDFNHLTDPQRVVILKDAADITRALVALDRRYTRHTPGWTRITKPDRLARAAEDCTLIALEHQADYTVDLHGWRPQPTKNPGTPPPGVAGLLHRGHNLALELDQFPDAHTLRTVLQSQRLLSRTLIDLINDPDLADHLRKREQTYHALVQATRNLVGPLGNTPTAAAEAIDLTRHAQQLAPEHLTDTTADQQLQPMLDTIDHQIERIIDHGKNQRLYLTLELGDLDLDKPGLIKHQREELVPLDLAADTSILELAAGLRHAPTPKMPPRDAATRRRDFDSEIAHHHRRDDAIGL